MIVIVDTKTGNVRSIKNMLKRIGVDSVISNESHDLLNANKIILPGVGAFAECMKNINKLDLLSPLNEAVLGEKKALCLGICLGAQILGKGSEEGDAEGLGWIDMEAKKFNLSPGFKVPHVGWNYTKNEKKSELLKNFDDEMRFYFTHSFYMDAKPEDTLISTNYEKDFAAGVNKNNIYGVQFHPEKSHKFGMKLLQNFSEL